MWTQLPSPKGAQPPIFGPYLLRPNGYMDQDVTWYGRRPRPRRFCVTLGPRSPSPKGGRGGPAKFWAHVYCGQTVGRIKTKLGMQVALDPGNIVLDGDPAPFPQKGAEPLLNFRPIYIVAKRLDASRYHLVWR